MPEPRRADADVMLRVKGLNVYYGRSHALQGVDLTLNHGVLSVVGRNGMGKTTLCEAIMGLTRASSGSIRVRGEEMLGLPPAQVARHGVGYVPQGRRLWRSLTVDEHLRMTAGGGSPAPGRSSASTMRSRASPNGKTTTALSSPAANSRCWRSPAR